MKEQHRFNYGDVLVNEAEGRFRVWTGPGGYGDSTVWALASEEQLDDLLEGCRRSMDRLEGRLAFLKSLRPQVKRQNAGKEVT